MRRHPFPRAPRLVAPWLVVAALVFPGACSQREPPAPPAAPPPPATPRPAPPQPAAAPAATGEVGTLTVTAAAALPFKVVDATTFAAVAKGTCNTPTTGVPVGNYVVRVDPPGHPEVALGPAQVTKGATTTLALGAYGRLKVKGPKDFLKFTVAGKDGKVVAKGDTNISELGLPVGEYTVAVAMGDLPPAEIKGVTVKAGAQTEAALAGFGRLKVTAPQDFLKFTVAGKDGKVVAKGDTNISVVLLPVGEYTVSVAVGDRPPALIKAVTVKDAAETEAPLTGFARLKVQAKQDFLKWTLAAKDGTVVAKGDTNISDVLVPAGTYTLAVAGAQVGPVTLTSGERKTFASGR
jgi:hypothetical protein